MNVTLIDRIKENHFWWYQGPMIAWAIALFTQSSIPGDRLPDFEFLSHDKLIHFFIYVVFAISVHRAIRFQRRFQLLAKHHYLFTIIIIALYGASDELHQYFVPDRSCSLDDWFADTLGAVLYATMHWLVTRLKQVIIST
jgi:VanZ family protein